jgi:bifunctional DNase/RNase
MTIEMKVSGIVLDPSTNVPILILKDAEERYTVPIWIGIIEASAIATELEKIALARPMTHDLLKNVLQLLGAEVEKIEVTDLRENTFFAEIHVRAGDARHVIDSRPSDAIALALRAGAPIFVEERVVQKLGEGDADKAPEGEKEPASPRPMTFTNLDPADRFDQEKWAEFLANLDPEDFGKYKM